jgi:hypothetical protein
VRLLSSLTDQPPAVRFMFPGRNLSWAAKKPCPSGPRSIGLFNASEIFHRVKSRVRDPFPDRSSGQPKPLATVSDEFSARQRGLQSWTRFLSR